MTKDELKEYLVVTAEYTEEEVEQMTDFKLVDAYLEYEGIVGFTTDIIDVVLHTFGFLSDNQDVDDFIIH